MQNSVEIKSHEKATVKSVQTDMHESEDRIQKLRSMRIDSKSLMMMDQQGSHTTSSNNNLQAIGGTNSDNAVIWHIAVVYFVIRYIAVMCYVILHIALVHYLSL